MRVRNIHTRIVCDKTEDELSVLPSMYEPVDYGTPLTQPKCCGADDTIGNEDDHDFLEEEDNA